MYFNMLMLILGQTVAVHYEKILEGKLQHVSSITKGEQ